LLLHAVKSTPVDGVIDIGICSAKAWVKIDIADSRREIEADDLPYVFARSSCSSMTMPLVWDWGCISRSES